jgi:catechol 2,3-dioxygenase-like lactoylglutathione lyase family enzyme
MRRRAEGPLSSPSPRKGACPRGGAIIKGLHHYAYRYRDSEETRRFYEDCPGLPLAHTLEIKETKSGRRTETLHTFCRLDGGSCLALFAAPDLPFEFKRRHDHDVQIALEVEPPAIVVVRGAGRTLPGRSAGRSLGIDQEAGAWPAIARR